MAELNFCPFCEAAQHKLMLCRENIFFCKQCSRFFRFEDLDVKCPRCKGQIQKADFPSSNGETVFLCVKCKRTYPATEILDASEIIPLVTESSGQSPLSTLEGGMISERVKNRPIKKGVCKNMPPS